MRELALGSVQAVLDAARRVNATGDLVQGRLDAERVAASFASERMFRLGGRTIDGFAPLSGFFRTADGWVRTHANYPHHRDRLLRLLEVKEPSRESLGAALAGAMAQQVEEGAAAVGAIAVRVRPEGEWRASPQGRAAAGPPVASAVRDDVAGRPWTPPGGPRPLAGVRVLDLTRVIAGPVCSRTLALLGAEVLRIDPPGLAEIETQHLDTGQGKRSALLDVRTDRSAAQRLLDEADVLVTGYRPGSVERLGLNPPAGIVRARINAWGDVGPWAARRGFDSIVQAASGIAMIESPDGEAPGALPAQALDHASGYLLAAAVVDALGDRARDGRGREVAAALARTATSLLDTAGRDPGHPPAATPSERTVVSHGDITYARPALPGIDDYPEPAHRWGSDPAAW